MTVEMARQTESLFLQAELTNDSEEARILNIRAGLLSELIFNLIPKSRPRTKAIIGTEAVTGFWRGQAWRDVLCLGPLILDQLDKGNEYHRGHINDMIEDAQRELHLGG